MRDCNFSLPLPGIAKPATSPFTSAMNTGTPAAEKAPVAAEVADARLQELQALLDFLDYLAGNSMLAGAHFQIIDEAVSYMDHIIRQGLADISSELYFSTKSIMVEGNLCFVQDSASQVTVFYDWVNKKVAGFQVNK